jgi:carboxysome shell carbonic anhydrase
VRAAFGRIVPVLKRISGLQHEDGFESKAQAIARSELGFELPERILGDAWVTQLDLRRLYAWCVFETYHRLCDEFFTADPLGGQDGAAFERFIQDCGFHLLDVTPCADGRMAHTVSYVLRLPHGPVRRKSSAGALFDVEDTVAKWVETELRRFREGVPNTADAPTRYLKAVVYHFSSADPHHEGCAAHGSDDAKAARAGLDRLLAFQQAVQNGFCCGASVDLLLIGQDTDTDAIRVHVPDRSGRIDLEQALDAAKVYAITRDLAPEAARARILELVRAHAPGTPDDGMVRLVARLIENNLSQIDYVRAFHGGAYSDVGHAERFIGAGIGFEEIQLRNLTYFAYLHTVEEATADLDVGIRIFTGLNVNHGLPVPIVVRFDYHGSIPGARDRAVARCDQVVRAIDARYPDLVKAGLLHTLRMVRDCDGQGARVEVIASSLAPAEGGGH